MHFNMDSSLQLIRQVQNSQLQLILLMLIQNQTPSQAFPQSCVTIKHRLFINHLLDQRSEAVNQDLQPALHTA